LHFVSRAACQDNDPVGRPNAIDLLHQETLRGNLKDVRLVQPPHCRFLLYWNQRVSNANQLIRSTDQAISTRAQGWRALNGIIRRLDRSTAETDLRTLAPTPAAQHCIDGK